MTPVGSSSEVIPGLIARDNLSYCRRIMFRVTLDGVIAVYLVIILCSVFFSWLAAAVFQAGRAKQRKKHFVICGICDHVYEDLSEEEISECPRCSAKNEREKILEI